MCTYQVITWQSEKTKNIIQIRWTDKRSKFRNIGSLNAVQINFMIIFIIYNKSSINNYKLYKYDIKIQLFLSKTLQLKMFRNF